MVPLWFSGFILGVGVCFLFEKSRNENYMDAYVNGTPYCSTAESTGIKVKKCWKFVEVNEK